MPPSYYQYDLHGRVYTMKSLSPRQTHLLHMLSDGACHSGQHLGDTLGISRTAIWKYIEQLTDLGLTIERIPHQGYRLSTSFIPLTETAIRQALTPTLNQELTFHLFASLDSTNRFLKTQPTSTSLSCCISEAQTMGRGRFGRHWHSPFGENIYCSFAWHSDGDPSHLSGLSLVVSLAIHATLKPYTTSSIAIKWPNDLLWHDKKLAGTLIEMTAESHGGTDLIIGIGLNINTQTQDDKTLERPWCSLRDIVGHSLDRNILIAELIIQLNQHLNRFNQAGFSDFHEQWDTYDYLKQRMVTLTKPSGTLTGKVLGVNDAGYLLLKDEHGITHTLSSGDTSLAQDTS
jgi:BirA family transcriptional regulator, biotin operon repressor / biotin---[acetyl-CoA-carboxylase] ligase